MLFHLLCSSMVSDEKSAVIQIVVPLYKMYHFSLTAFRLFFSFSLVFSNLITTGLEVNFFGFMLFQLHYAS